MNDFNYEGAAGALEPFGIVTEFGTVRAKAVVAAFLADNKLFQILQTDKDYDPTSKTLFAKNEYGLIVGRLVQAGGSDE